MVADKIVVREPPCFQCRNYVLWPVCLAFPRGIPDDVRNGDNDHHAPIEGDKGLQFDPIVKIAKAVTVRGPLRRVERGGPGSGHFGHEGRPGEVGGSQPSLKPGEPTGVRGRRYYPKWSDEKLQTVLDFIESEYDVREPEDILPDFRYSGMFILPNGRIMKTHGEHRAVGEKLFEYLGPEFFDNVYNLDWETVEMQELYDQGFIRMTIDFYRRGDSLSTIYLSFEPGTLTKQAKETITQLYWQLYDREAGGTNFFLSWQDENGEQHALSMAEGSQWPADIDDISRTLGFKVDRSWIERGGPGSGHHGHEGRPGEVGGSKPSSGAYDKLIPLGEDRGSLTDIEEEFDAKRKDGEFLWIFPIPRILAEGKIFPESDELEEGKTYAAVFTDKERALEYLSDYMRELDHEVLFYMSDHGEMMYLTQNHPSRVIISQQDIWAFRELRRKPENSNIIQIHNHPGPDGFDADYPPSWSDFQTAMNEDLEEWWVVTDRGKYVVTQGDNYDQIPAGSSLARNWNVLQTGLLPEYFERGDDEDDISFYATHSPETAQEFVNMRMKMITDIFVDTGYYNVEFEPNE